MLDSDLARLYGVATKRLNEQVKRNLSRFPEDFMFMLSKQELSILRSQIATSSASHGGRRSALRVFTEHGAVMLANVLNSPAAVAMSVHVVRAFVRTRRISEQHKDLAAEIGKLSAELQVKFREYDDQFRIVFEAISRLITAPEENRRRQIGFTGRIS